MSGRPLRALFVDEGIGGHRTVRAGLQRALAERDDVDAEFLVVPDPGLLGKVLRRPVPGLGRLDLDLQPLRAQLVRSAWLRRALERVLPGNGTGFDVVHVYTQNTALLSAHQLRRVPAVVTTDSTTTLNAYRLPYRPPTRFTPWTVRASVPFERRVLHAAGRVVANSGEVAGALGAVYDLHEPRLVRLPFGVWLPPRPRPRPDRRPVIAFVGHQLERKGGNRLLRLHQEHLRDRCDLLLVTTEPVPPLPGVTVVSDLQGGSDRLWGVLAEADVFCFPSTIDQAPNAVLEAAAAGLPVVALPVGAVPEMVVDGVTGALVPLGDDAALLDALVRLLDDPALRRRQGCAGRAHMEACYDMRMSVDALVRVLRDVAAEGPRGIG